jgi:hypothetical protein
MENLTIRLERPEDYAVIPASRPTPSYVVNCQLPCTVAPA